MEHYLSYMSRYGLNQENYCWLDEFLELKTGSIWQSGSKLSGSAISIKQEDSNNRVASADSILNTVPQVNSQFRLFSSRSISIGSRHTSSRGSIGIDLSFSRSSDNKNILFEDGSTCFRLLEQLNSGLFFNDPKNVFVSTLEVFSPKESRLPRTLPPHEIDNFEDSLRSLNILAQSSPLHGPAVLLRIPFMRAGTKKATSPNIKLKKPEETSRFKFTESVEKYSSDSGNYNSTHLNSGSDSDYSDGPRPKKKRKIGRSIAKSRTKPQEVKKLEISDAIVPLTSTALVNKARRSPETQDHTKNLIHLLDQSECTIKRERFERKSLDKYDLSIDDLIYEFNENFSISAPYQQEFTRIKVCPKTKMPIPATRSALCAYCKELNFFELKNSSYSQHMCHTHGIFTNDYLTPDPLFLGSYFVKKPCSLPRKTNRRSREREGVVCPVCYTVVEVRCWKTKLEQNPFSNYLRHFKKEHRMLGVSLIYYLETKN